MQLESVNQLVEVTCIYQMEYALNVTLIVMDVLTKIIVIIANLELH